MIDQLIKHRDRMLPVSIGIVYLWFGFLKFFSGMSPAEALAKETLSLLTFGLVPASVSYFVLAIWEVTIGIFLLFNFQKKLIIHLALIHILFTFTPLFLLPSLSFNHNLYSLSLAGQYIIKNLVIFSALLYVYPEKQKADVPQKTLSGILNR